MAPVIRKPTILIALFAAFLLEGCSSGGRTPPRTFQLGERVELGHIVYTVFETQWLTQIGEGMDARVPQNRFFLVRLSAANTSSGELYVPPISIRNDGGQSFDELANGDGFPQWMGLVRRVLPTEPLQGNVAFDAPAAHYRLVLTDENQAQTAYVEIPLTFEMEKQLPVKENK